MAGLVPAIHVCTLPRHRKDVDARDKRGHDDLDCGPWSIPATPRPPPSPLPAFACSNSAIPSWARRRASCSPIRRRRPQDRARGGDPTRRLSGFAAGFFPAFNRNKRSLALDLKAVRDARCSTGWRRRRRRHRKLRIRNHGAVRLRLSRLAAKNPRLIYCALKGFLTGPYEHRPALDEIVQFMAGWLI